MQSDAQPAPPAPLSLTQYESDALNNVVYLAQEIMAYRDEIVTTCYVLNHEGHDALGNSLQNLVKNFADLQTNIATVQTALGRTK